MKSDTKHAALAASVCALVLGASGLMAQTSIGQWDFNHSNLVQTAGANLGDLQYANDGGVTSNLTVFAWTTNFAIPDIAGTPAQVIRVPAGAFPMGLFMPTPPANGGGSLVNNYTILLDILYPVGGFFRPLVQMDDGNLDHIFAYLAVGANDAMAATNTSGRNLPSALVGQLGANTWNRLGFVVNTTSGEIDFYTNGVRAGVLKGVGTLDSPYALLASDILPLLSSPQTNAQCYVNSIQLRDVALNAGQMRALGPVSAPGIPVTIPPVSTFVVSQSPDQSEITGPSPAIHFVLDQGDSTLNTGSVQLSLDGAVVAATVAPGSPNQFTVDFSVTTIFDPASLHTLKLVYQDNLAGYQTNDSSFVVATYQNITLPPPIYTENFDEVAEGGVPAGWVVTNWTDTLVSGLNLFDTQSDSYKDWVTISDSDYASVYPDTDNYISPGFPQVSGNRRQMIPPIVLNGVLLSSLVSGNLITAESDQRDGSQVQVLFSSDFNLTGYTNVYLSFHNVNEQNQDNICSVEYSIDQGVTWLPLLYMLDDGTTDGDGSDVVTNGVTGQIDVFATFGTARNDQAHGLAYSNFIGAPVSTNLIPAIRPCRNDDPVQQKRIEVLRLPLADNQAHVRFRFGQAGTGSWFFALDDFGLYSINLPIINVAPLSQNIEANTPVTFTVSASGPPPLSYQWKYNGANIASATGTSYNIPAVAPANAGQYSVVVGNTSGQVRSAPATLTVITNPVLLASPVFEVADPSASVTFSGSVQAGRPLTVTWYHDGVAVPNSNGTALTLNNLRFADAGNYQFIASNSYGSVTSLVANLTIYSGPITNSLVLHLPFDSNFNDTSGHANNATYQYNGASANPNPTFMTGRIGSAFQTTTHQDSSAYEYATLGYPDDLKLDDTNSFSVSLWVNYTNQGDDIPMISNKDWDSSDNRGWGIFTQGSGKYRVNVTGPNSSADKFSQSNTGVVGDGAWHNLVVSFVRAPFGYAGYVYCYVDGVVVNKTPMAVALSIDTDSLPFTDHQTAPPVPTPIQSVFAVNVGQDGTGVYTDNHSGHLVALFDDLGFWRRALTPGEALGIYRAGLSGKDLSQAAAVVRLSFTVSGSNLVISWPASPSLKLQKSSSLNPAVWTDVPGTLGAGSATVPLSGPAGYFRLSQ